MNKEKDNAYVKPLASIYVFSYNVSAILTSGNPYSSNPNPSYDNTENDDFND